MIDNLLYCYDNFSIKEAFSKCSDQEIKECIDKGLLPNVLTLLHHLDNVRNIYNAPIIISSAFRDLKHNTLVGGSTTSQHLQGAAVDVLTSVRHFFIDDLQRLLLSVLKYNESAQCFGQIIVYRNFLHLGLRDSARPSCDHLSILVCKDNDLIPIYELLKSCNYPVKRWNR